MSSLFIYSTRVHQSGYEWDVSLGKGNAFEDERDTDILIPKKRNDKLKVKPLGRYAFIDFANLTLEFKKPEVSNRSIVENFYNQYGVLTIPVETIERDYLGEKITTTAPLYPDIKMIKRFSKKMFNLIENIELGEKQESRKSILDEALSLNADIELVKTTKGRLDYKFVPRYLLTALQLQLFEHRNTVNHIKVCIMEDCRKLFMSVRNDKKTCSESCRQNKKRFGIKGRPKK